MGEPLDTLETREKLARVRTLFSGRGAAGLLIGQQSHFSWLTGGRGHVSTASDGACARVLVTHDDVFLLADRIEARRLTDEEVTGALAAKVHIFPWHDETAAATELGRIVDPQRLVSDASLTLEEVMRLRFPLTAAETVRFRALGRDTGEAVEEAARRVRRGQTEWQVAGVLAHACLDRGMDPVVNLIAGDRRIYDYRHPLPTGRMIDNYVMLVACARRHGLIASATRLVHFGPVPPELRARHAAALRVDGLFIASTRPGARVGDILTAAEEAYAREGYPGEWELHHQGGPAAYAAREYLATSRSGFCVQAGEVYAWNPSVTGAKSEDTILVGEGGCEILTRTGDFPEVGVTVDGQEIPRPDVLVRSAGR